MGVTDTLFQLRTNPQMKKLSFQEQQQIVKMLYDKEFQTNPELISMDPQKKTELYQFTMQERVKKWVPVLSTSIDPLTDDDRLRLDQGFDVGPQTAVKKALRLKEKLDTGDPNAQDEARRWIVGNRALTESLLAKVVLGAKDGIEVLFGQDDQMFNDLRFSAQDYSKLTDYLLAGMDEQEAQTAQTRAAIVGLGVGLVETVALEAATFGTLQNPGLFTKGLWNTVKTLKSTATTAQATARAATLIPYTISGVGSGLVDLARTLPQLLETKQIEGNNAFWKKAALAFGTGVAYDVLFRTFEDVYKIAIRPVIRDFAGYTRADQNMVKEVGEILTSTDPKNWAPLISKVFNKTAPVELLDKIPPKYRKELVGYLKRIQRVLDIKDFDMNSEDGFRFVAKAMGMDVEFDPSGKVKVLNSKGKVKQVFNTRSEAVSWAQARDFRSFSGELEPEVLGAQRLARIRTFADTDKSITSLNTRQLTHLFGTLGADGRVDRETTLSAVQELARRGRRNEMKFRIGTIDEYNKQMLQAELSQTKLKDLTEFVIPDQMNPQMRVEVLSRLDEVFKIKGSLLPGLDLKTATLTEEGLDYAASLIDGTIIKDGNTWKLTLPGLQPEIFHEQRTLNSALFGYMVDSGLIPEDEFATLLKRQTGYKLKVTANPETGLPSYEVWSSAGTKGSRLLQRADSLRSLATSAPEYELKLPDPFAFFDFSGKLTRRIFRSGFIRDFFDQQFMKWQDAVTISFDEAA